MHWPLPRLRCSLPIPTYIKLRHQQKSLFCVRPHVARHFGYRTCRRRDHRSFSHSSLSPRLPPRCLAEGTAWSRLRDALLCPSSSSSSSERASERSRVGKSVRRGDEKEGRKQEAEAGRKKKPAGRPRRAAKWHQNDTSMADSLSSV